MKKPAIPWPSDYNHCLQRHARQFSVVTDGLGPYRYDCAVCTFRFDLSRMTPEARRALVPVVLMQSVIPELVVDPNALEPAQGEDAQASAVVLASPSQDSGHAA